MKVYQLLKYDLPVLIICENLRNLWILKMQNKPKFQKPKNSISPYEIRTKNSELRTAEGQNKPKQTQTCHPGLRAGIQCINSHLEEVHIFLSGVALAKTDDIYNLIFNIMKNPLCPLWQNIFMTNKPNSQKPKKFISPYEIRTKNSELRTAEGQNKPKQTQYILSRPP